MPIIFQTFAPEEDIVLREHVAHTSGFDVTDAQRWTLQGAPLGFYKEKVFLCFVAEGERHGPEERRYFLAHIKGSSERKRVAFYLPIGNRPGEIARVNRELHLKLTEKNIVAYLHFYYRFTPQQDPLLRNLKFEATQFFVPLAFDDLDFEAAARDASASERCSPICLARGSAWRFLDEERHERTVPIKFRKRFTVPRVSGRVLVQFLDALFAVDFRVPLSTGIPVLSNPDLLYQHASLNPPEHGIEVPLPRTVGVREVIDDLWALAVKATKGFAGHVGNIALRVLTLVIVCTWLASAVFPIFEALQWPWLRNGLAALGQWMSRDWPWTLKAVTMFGLFFALALIFYTTHMDKVFNWILMLCPHGWKPLVAPLLNRQVDKQDRDFNAQDTFRKRATWALKRFISWTAYLVLAFASLQIAEDLLSGQAPHGDTSALRIIATFAIQALLNIPLVYYLLTRFPWADLMQFVDLGALGSIHTGLLFWFHAAMATVVIKGVYRMWVLTVEASPHAFYRRLRVKGDPPPRRQRRR